MAIEENKSASAKDSDDNSPTMSIMKKRGGLKI